MDDTSIRDVIALFRAHEEARIGAHGVQVGGKHIASEELLRAIWRLIADVDDLANLLDAVHNQLETLVPDDLKSFDDDYIETRVNLITSPDDWRE